MVKATHGASSQPPASRQAARAKALIAAVNDTAAWSWPCQGPLPVPIAGKAFAPILQANGGGALLNVLSVASWINGGELAAYSASKSAAWSLTNALRQELAAQKRRCWACTWPMSIPI